MKKIFIKLIIIFVMVCTISTTSLAGNMTNKDGAGTVTWNKELEAVPGSEQNPYQLVMGEPLIDIYYGKHVKDQYVYFEFTSGNYNAGNYLVEQNADKKRIRLTLIGTGEEDLRVVSEEGASYRQAGGITYVPNIEDFKVSQPFYNIEAIESVKGGRGHSMDSSFTRKW